MTALIALALIAGVLAIIVSPLFTRRPLARVRQGGSTLIELDERYKSALADLQDTEMDWQVGNLSEADYRSLRDRYRMRAAETLREIDARKGLRAAAQAEVQRARTRIPETYDVPDAADEQARPMGRPGAARYAAIGGAIAAVAVIGITLMYVRTAGLQAAQAPRAVLPITHAHAVAVGDRGELWVAHHDGLLRSADGTTWQTTPLSGDAMALVDDGGRKLVFGHDVLAESTDGGATWQLLAHNLPGTDVHGAQRGSDGIYAYVIDFGLFRSPDGTRWEPVADPFPQDVGALAVLPRAAGGETLFLAAGGTVLSSTNGGRTWASAAGAVNLALNGFVRAIGADPTRGALYAATSDGLYRSQTNGADWVRLPFRGPAAAVGARGDRIGVVDDRGQFFLSTDGGGTWLAN